MLLLYIHWTFDDDRTNTQVNVNRLYAGHRPLRNVLDSRPSHFVAVKGPNCRFQKKRLGLSEKGRHGSGRNTNVVNDCGYVCPQTEFADSVGVERHYNRVAGPE